ncbi:hypothetical protein D3C85_15330 [compost metagenome]
MHHDVEQTGPLTPKQHKYLLASGYAEESLHELDLELKHYAAILKHMPRNDIAFGRMNAMHAELTKVADLKRRFETHGVSAVVDLTEVVKEG